MGERTARRLSGSAIDGSQFARLRPFLAVLLDFRLIYKAGSVYYAVSACSEPAPPDFSSYVEPRRLARVHPQAKRRRTMTGSGRWIFLKRHLSTRGIVFPVGGRRS